MRRPRLVASDLDGTLLRSDGTVSSATREALDAVEAAGVPLVLVTGRPPRWLHDIAEQTGHRGIAVCANGALTYDLHSGQVVRHSALDPQSAADVVAALRRDLPGLSFAVERAERGFGHEPAYRPRWDPGDAEVAELEALLTADVVKLLARHDEMGPDALLEAGRRSVGALGELTHSSRDGLLEISATGVSKASGLAAVAAEHGVAAEHVVGFGDMPNDLPLLEWAGWGVAVANAHPEVRAVADEVAPSNDEDGVAAVLRRWFP